MTDVTAQPARVRMAWMDLLRGTAVVVVVLWHATTIPAILGGDPPQWLLQVGQALHPYPMPMLMFLSGMLLPRGLATGLPTYYAGVVGGVLWPYALWTVITAIAAGSVGSLANGWTWVGGSHHLWFLAVLLATYLVGPLTRLVPAWLWVLPMVLLSPVPSTNAYERILWFGAFFLAGAAAVRYVDRWQRQDPLLPTLLAACSVGYVGWLAAGGSLEGEGLRPFVGSSVGIAFLVWLAPRLPRVRWLERAGRDSIVLYLVHLPVIAASWLLVRDLDLSWWLLAPPLFLVGLGIPWMILRWSRSILFRLPDPSRRRRDDARAPCASS